MNRSRCCAARLGYEPGAWWLCLRGLPLPQTPLRVARRAFCVRGLATYAERHTPMIRLSTASPDFEAGFAALLSQARETTETVDQAVAAIIA